MDAAKINHQRNCASSDNFFGREALGSLLEYAKRPLPIGVVPGGDPHASGAVIQTTHDPRSDKTSTAVAADIADALGRLGLQNIESVPEQMPMGERLKKWKAGLVRVQSGGTQGFSSICHAPSMREMLGIPYIGHNLLKAALLNNKHAKKPMLAGLSINTPDFFVCDFKSDERIQ